MTFTTSGEDAGAPPVSWRFEVKTQSDKPSKRHKSAPIPIKTWEVFKPTIYQKYMTENYTLPALIAHMETEYHFSASKRQYTDQFKRWGMNKYARGTSPAGIIQSPMSPTEDSDRSTPTEPFRSVTEEIETNEESTPNALSFSASNLPMEDKPDDPPAENHDHHDHLSRVSTMSATSGPYGDTNSAEQKYGQEKHLAILKDQFPQYRMSDTDFRRLVARGLFMCGVADATCAKHICHLLYHALLWKDYLNATIVHRRLLEVVLGLQGLLQDLDAVDTDDNDQAIISLQNHIVRLLLHCHLCFVARNNELDDLRQWLFLTFATIVQRSAGCLNTVQYYLDEYDVGVEQSRSDFFMHSIIEYLMPGPQRPIDQNTGWSRYMNVHAPSVASIESLLPDSLVKQLDGFLFWCSNVPTLEDEYQEFTHQAYRRCLAQYRQSPEVYEKMSFSLVAPVMENTILNYSLSCAWSLLLEKEISVDRSLSIEERRVLKTGSCFAKCAAISIYDLLETISMGAQILDDHQYPSSQRATGYGTVMVIKRQQRNLQRLCRAHKGHSGSSYRHGQLLRELLARRWAMNWTPNTQSQGSSEELHVFKLRAHNALSELFYDKYLTWCTEEDAGEAIHRIEVAPPAIHASLTQGLQAARISNDYLDFASVARRHSDVTMASSKTSLKMPTAGLSGLGSATASLFGYSLSRSNGSIKGSNQMSWSNSSNKMSLSIRSRSRPSSRMEVDERDILNP